MNARGRGGPRRGLNRNVANQLAMLKSSLHGHENRLKATDPPPFTRKPFNTITVEAILEHAENGQVTVTGIISALRSQLDMALSQDVTIKIKRIDLWVPGLLATPSIRGRFFSLVMAQSTSSTTSHSILLKSLQDIGTLGASAAVVSYSWPRDQQDIPLNPETSDGQPVFEYTTAHDESQVYARYHLLWCTGDPSTSPVTKVY